MQSLRDNGRKKPHRAVGPPSHILPRNPVRRSRWIAWIARSLVIAGLAAGCAITVKSGLPVAAAAQAADAIAVRVGLGVNQIAVTGSRNTLSDDIFAALNLAHDGSLLTYDVSSARNHLEALPWVEFAQVTRILPDGLDVTIRERQPFAVWQRRQLMFLIDADGRTLEPASRTDHPDLPFVVGEEADSGARSLLQMLQAYPAIRDRLDAAICVGGRRWDLQLKSAPTLMLPEEHAAEALAWADRMQRDERLLDRRIAAIDLRIDGKVTFYPVPNSGLKSASSLIPRNGGV